MREMRRICKPNCVVAVRDMASQIIVPLLPPIAAGVEAVARMYAARGADRFIGQRTHSVAHAAGFAWEEIEMSTQGAELVSGADEREAFGQAVKGRFTEELLAGGFATVDECEGLEGAWVEWSERADGRIMGVSGSLVCRKSAGT